jgi:16S rRNA C1402 N4-methylase RsmH
MLKRLTLTNHNFSSICETKVVDKFDLILADFGFNTFHLETERGFSWLKDEPLDMRYTQSTRSCRDIVDL